jgi:DNA-binding transcriptional LysR family regulator
MNLSQLYYFRTLTQVKSYKKAAAELFISEPTLSVAIKKLEAELGCELLERKRHTITLTPDGEEFAECVELSLSNLDAHVEAIKRRSRNRNDVLRIGIVFSAQQRIWSPLVNQFWRAEGTDPNSIIRQGTTGQLIRELKRGEIDVFIAGNYPEDPELVHYPMWYSNVLAVINKENPLASRESVTFDDIRNYPIISYTLNGPVGDDTKKIIEAFDLKGDFTYPNEPSLCSNVVVNPNTIALVCDSWLAFGFDKVAIVPISDAPKVFHRFWLTHLAALPKTNTLLRRFIDFATTYDFSNSPCDFVGPEMNML